MNHNREQHEHKGKRKKEAALHQYDKRRRERRERREILGFFSPFDSYLNSSLSVSYSLFVQSVQMGKKTKAGAADEGWTTVTSTRSSKGKQAPSKSVDTQSFAKKVVLPDPTTQIAVNSLYQILAEKEKPVEKPASVPAVANKAVEAPKGQPKPSGKERNPGAAAKKAAPVVVADPTVADLAKKMDESWIVQNLAMVDEKYPSNVESRFDVIGTQIDEFFAPTKAFVDASNFVKISATLNDAISKSVQTTLGAWIAKIKEPLRSQLFFSAVNTLDQVIAKKYPYRIPGFGLILLTSVGIRYNSHLQDLRHVASLWKELQKTTTLPKLAVTVIQSARESPSLIIALWTRCIVPEIMSGKIRGANLDEYFVIGEDTNSLVSNLKGKESVDDIIPVGFIKTLFQLKFEPGAKKNITDNVHTLLVSQYEPFRDYYISQKAHKLFDFYLSKTCSGVIDIRYEASKISIDIFSTMKGMSAWNSHYIHYMDESYNLLLDIDKNFALVSSKVPPSEIEKTLNEFIRLHHEPTTSESTKTGQTSKTPTPEQIDRNNKAIQAIQERLNPGSTGALRGILHLTVLAAGAFLYYDCQSCVVESICSKLHLCGF